jgi:hypothetical protein
MAVIMALNMSISVYLPVSKPMANMFSTVRMAR